MSNFDTAIARLLGNEGGYSNNPADPGGETQWGISKRSYPKLNIKGLTRAQAIELYHRDFWSAIDGDNIPFCVGFQLLDFAVNSGTSTALRILQRAVGVADDGHIGLVTRAAIKAKQPHDLVMLFLAERLLFMTSLTGWQSFGKGWARRIATNLKLGADDV